MTITGPSLGALFTAAWLSSLTALTSLCTLLCTCPELPAVVFTWPLAVLSARAKTSPFSNKTVIFGLIANCMGQSSTFWRVFTSSEYRRLRANICRFFHYAKCRLGETVRDPNGQRNA